MILVSNLFSADGVNVTAHGGMAGMDGAGHCGSLQANLSSEVTRCGCMDAEYVEIWQTTQWLCEGTLFTAVGAAGLLFNLLSIGILATKEMRKHTFNQLLIALCVCDVIFILVSVPVYAFSMFQIFVGNQVLRMQHTEPTANANEHVRIVLHIVLQRITMVL